MCQFRARSLTHLDLAGHNRDDSVFADVDPRSDIAWATSSSSSSSSTSLRQGGPDIGCHEQAGAEQLNEVAPVEIEMERNPFTEFLGIETRRLDGIGFSFHN